MYIDSNAGGVGPSKLVHTEQGTEGFSFCLTRVWSGFAQIFSHYISISPPWNSNVQSAPLYFGSIRCVFYHSNRMVTDAVGATNKGILQPLW